MTEPTPAPEAAENAVPPEQTAPATPPADPSAAPAPAQVAQPSAAPAASGGGKKVLIVEDERPLAHALELKLKHDGYETEVASTGPEGLQKALNGQFNVMLLDLILPEKDGFAVLEELRAGGSNIPVIVLSNLGQAEDKERTAQFNVAQYCVKANTPLSTIVQIIEQVAS